MKKTLSFALVLVGAFSVAVARFAAAGEPVGYLEGLWLLAVLATVVLFGGCALVPERVVALQSMPWTFQIRRNLDLGFQSLTYETFHTNWWSRGTHYLLAPEQVAWFVLLGAWHPWLPIAAFTGLALQAALLGEHPFSILLCLAWGAVILLAHGLLLTMGAERAVPVAQAFLLIAALVRVLGHLSEPLPPMLAERSDRFARPSDVGLRPRTLFIAIAGYVSEFASALPGRLFVVQLYQLSLACGYQPRTTADRGELKRSSRRIRQEGWRAHPETAPLFEPLLGSSALTSTTPPARSALVYGEPSGTPAGHPALFRRNASSDN